MTLRVQHYSTLRKWERLSRQMSREFSVAPNVPWETGFPCETCKRRKTHKCFLFFRLFGVTGYAGNLDFIYLFHYSVWTQLFIFFLSCHTLTNNWLALANINYIPFHQTSVELSLPLFSFLPLFSRLFILHSWTRGKKSASCDLRKISASSTWSLLGMSLNNPHIVPPTMSEVSSIAAPWWETRLYSSKLDKTQVLLSASCLSFFNFHIVTELNTNGIVLVFRGYYGHAKLC